MNNDLFYTCSLIEYIGRETKNTKAHVIKALGRDNIEKIYNLASIYHCEDINMVKDDYVKKCNIKIGDYDILKNKKNFPTYFDMGKVYARLINKVYTDSIIDAIIEVMSSWIIEKIDDYDSSLYYENENYIYKCYVDKKII